VRVVATLPEAEVDAALASLPGWSVEGGAVAKEFSLPSFLAAIELVNTVAGLAEAANHHPDLDIRYNRVRVALVTHSAGGITDKDVDMARRIEAEATG
jgi:4a-hydroxytetrahydrobiopterin dehydratase